MDLQPSPPPRRPRPQAPDRSPQRAEQPGWVLHLALLLLLLVALLGARAAQAHGLARRLGRPPRGLGCLLRSLGGPLGDLSGRSHVLADRPTGSVVQATRPT